MAAARKTAHEKVMEFVERELEKEPGIGSAELQEKAKKVSRIVSRLSVRQFHAKYPLQVKRRKGSSKPAKRRSRPKRQAGARRGTAAGNPDAVRAVLLDFAQKLSAAEGQPATIAVLADLDRYVDRAMKAAG